MQLKTNHLAQTAGVLLLSFLLSTTASGQKKETAIRKAYLQLGAGASNHDGVSSDLGAQLILKNNWTTTFSYQSMEMDPKNLPSDYDPGYTIFIAIPIPNSNPTANMNLVSLTGGKYFEAGRSVWFTAEAGLSIATGEKYSFAKKAGDQSLTWYLFFGEQPSNYTVTKEKKTTIGGMLKADVNWAITSFAGLGAGVFANVNSIQSPVGFQIKLICGWMNRPSKK